MAPNTLHLQLVLLSQKNFAVDASANFCGSVFLLILSLFFNFSTAYNSLYIRSVFHVRHHANCKHTKASSF